MNILNLSPYNRGYRDGLVVRPFANPYSRTDEPFEWEEYKSGYNMAQVELQNDLENMS